MKFVFFLLIAFAAIPALANDLRTGEDVIAAMHKKYDGKWYKTLTFVQKTIHHNPDGTTKVETWNEAMGVPGNLRIDFADSKTGDGMLFTRGQIFVYRDGKPATGRSFVHPLMILGFDVYNQPVARTIEQVKAMGIDLAILREDEWQGRKVYVVGAQKDDLTTPQVWIDKKNLVFVRLFQLGGREKKNVNETQFNKYFKAGGGMVAPEVLFFTDGKLVTTEEYTQVRTNVKLDASLWDPEKWTTADRTYWKENK